MNSRPLLVLFAAAALAACGRNDHFPDASPGDVAASVDVATAMDTPRADGPTNDTLASDTSTPDTLAPADAPIVPCPASAACGACTSLSGCGYCATTSSCVAASADDATSADGTCFGAAWANNPSACARGDGGPDPSGCGASTTCDDCDSNPDCGWCTSTMRCLLANDDGTASADGTCTGSDFDDIGLCMAPDDCTTASNCGDCTGLATCGWCAGTDHCLSGTADGSDDGACTGASWAWTGDMCPDDADAGTLPDGG